MVITTVAVHLRRKLARLINTAGFIMLMIMMPEMPSRYALLMLAKTNRHRPGSLDGEHKDQ